MGVDTIILNGKLSESGVCITPDNRSFRFGDGCFETMLALCGEVVFFDEHFNRINSTCDYLGIKLPFNRTELAIAVRTLLDHFGFKEAALRLTVYRRGGGRYTPPTDESDWLLQAEKHQSNLPQLQRSRCGILNDLKMPCHPIYNHKTNARLLNVLAAQICKQRKWDDALLMNQRDEYCETVSGNLYVVCRDLVYTPPLDSGCLDGVMRRRMAEVVGACDMNLVEQPIDHTAIAEADEIWSTNSLYGIKAFDNFDNRPLRTHRAECANIILYGLMINSTRDFRETLP
ncbi:MAG: aminodeoxychorismate lyase [Salibacteraceae bacterium]